MSIEEMIDSTQIFLSPADVADVLRCDPQCIRTQAQADPGKLGYPVIVTNRRI